MSTINVDYIQSASMSYVTIDTNLAVNGEVTPRWPKIYTALISQSGTNDPTVIELQNTIGSITWTRNSAGIYNGFCSGAFTVDKTALLIGTGTLASDVNQFLYDTSFTFRRNTDDVVILTSQQNNTISDGILDTTTIEIRVYN